LDYKHIEKTNKSFSYLKSRFDEELVDMKVSRREMQYNGRSGFIPSGFNPLLMISRSNFIKALKSLVM